MEGKSCSSLPLKRERGTRCDVWALMIVGSCCCRRNETLNSHESTRAVVVTSLLWSCGEILKSYVLVVRLSLFSRNILSFTVSHYLPMQSLTMLLIMTTIDTMMVHTITTDYYYYLLLPLFPLSIRLILGGSSISLVLVLSNLPAI